MSAVPVEGGSAAWTWSVPISSSRAVMPSIMPVDTSMTTSSGTRLRAMPTTAPRR